MNPWGCMDKDGRSCPGCSHSGGRGPFQCRDQYVTVRDMEAAEFICRGLRRFPKEVGPC